MEKAKEILAFTVMALILLSSSLVLANGNIQFKDTKPTDWYVSTVSKLIDLKGIAGFPDGTFRPNIEIKKGEFIKIIVGSLGFDEGPSAVGHWANNYRRRAVLIGLIDASEFNKLDEVISRYEMAKVIIQVIEYKDESHIENRDKYIYQIKDYNKTPLEYKDYVLKAYTKGLISGYPDGEFKGYKGVSRAEASVVIMRVLDSKERKLPPEATEEAKTEKLTEADIKRLQGYEIKLAGAAIGFDEFDDNEAERWIDELWSKILIPKNLKIHSLDPITMKPAGDFNLIKEVSEYDFITSPKTVYKGVFGDRGIRGVLRVKYDKQNNARLVPGKYHERDITIYIKNSDNSDGSTSIKISEIKYLSDWREVK